MEGDLAARKTHLGHKTHSASHGEGLRTDAVAKAACVARLTATEGPGHWFSVRPAVLAVQAERSSDEGMLLKRDTACAV